MQKLSAMPNVAKTDDASLRKPRGLRPQAGQTMLELALLLPLLLILVFGVIEMGRYMYIDTLIGSAARAGAIYGAQNPAASVQTADIVAAACNDFLSRAGTNLGSRPAPTCDGSGTASTNHLGITSSVSCGCDTAGTVVIDDTTAALCNVNSNPALAATQSACIPPTGTGHWAILVTVTASGEFDALFKYPFVPTSITITKTATMRVQ